MSVSRPTGSTSDENGGKDKDRTVAKTAGFVVFSGIAMSILKALNPCNNNKNNNLINNNNKIINNESPSPLQESKSPPPFQEPTKNPKVVCNGSASSAQTIDIVKGDTLWGLSRKYGVSIDAIKEANGLTGNTIYAGKKLVIP